MTACKLDVKSLRDSPTPSTSVHHHRHHHLQRQHHQQHYRHIKSSFFFQPPLSPTTTPTTTPPQRNVRVYIQMELCDATLSHYLRQRQSLRPSHNWHMVRQLFQALQYLHEACIVHRDVKVGRVKPTPNLRYFVSIIMKE